MFTHTYIPVLTIAGSDSGGGAGIQADLKTFAALGCYGMSAITAVTAQNTFGITAIHPVPAVVLRAQIDAVLPDIGAAAIKIGMVCSEEQIEELQATLARSEARDMRDAPEVLARPTPPIILDPVLVSTSGTPLLAPGAMAALRKNLFPLAALITPNLPEAEALCGFPVREVGDMRKAAGHLLETGAGAVLVKGGHLTGGRIRDLYVDTSGRQLVFESDRIESTNLHGTGCTLSAAIAAWMALGEPLENAIARARAYVLRAIGTGQYIRTGHGQGPLNHAHAAQTTVLRPIPGRSPESSAGDADQRG